MSSINLGIRGKVTECITEPTPVCETVVYQKTKPGSGNIPGDPTGTLQRRRWVIPYDPQTAPQLARRAVFADAVSTWQAMTTEEQDAWAEIGNKRNLPGYHTFLSAYLNNH